MMTETRLFARKTAEYATTTSVEASKRRRRESRRRAIRRRARVWERERFRVPRHNTHTRDGNASQRLSRVTTSLARRQVPSPTNALAPERAAARTTRFPSRFAFRALRDFPDFPDLEGHGVLGEEVLALRRLGNHAQERLQRQTRDREQGGEQDGHREAELALALWSFGARPEAKSQSEDTRKRRFPTRSTDRACREKPRRDRARRRRRDGGPSARAARARATAFALATVRAAEHDIPRSSRRAPPSPP